MHGNTGASLMLQAEAEYYSHFFQVMTMDLIGHGFSARLDEWPDDYWRTNANIAAALCAHLRAQSVHVLGTSGGAIVALNMAVEAPSQVRSVVADSFVGTPPSLSDAEAIARQRQEAKSGPARGFWIEMHGSDWEQVVDADTRMLLRFARAGASFFRDQLAGVKCPVLLTASLEDEFIRDPREMLRTAALQIPNAETELFESGCHPAMLSNAERFRSRVMGFLQRQDCVES
jgi:pimeloyl-ACP methyl ester carboxylesterase